MTRIAIPPARVLTTIKDKLIEDGVFNSTTCYLRIKKQQPIVEVPGGDFECSIDFLSEVLDQGIAYGSGNDVLMMVTNVITTIRWINAQDEMSRSTSILTDANYGALRKFQYMMKSLELYDPIQDETDPIFSQPMRLVYKGEITKEEDAPQWLNFPLVWEVKYTMDIEDLPSLQGQFNSEQFDNEQFLVQEFLNG